MNIDLLLTPQGEAGLVSDKSLGAPVAGVMYDALTGQVILEFADAESLELNIHVEQECGANLLNAHFIHVGVIEKGIIADSRQVPLILQLDPFGGGNFGQFAGRPRQSPMAFESFMRRANSGQPVHRDDLGDEAAAGSVMGGMSAAVLQFAPHLSRQRALEAAPKAAPSAPGPRGPGGMGGGGGGPPPVQRQQPQQPPQQYRDDDED